MKIAFSVLIMLVCCLARIQAVGKQYAVLVAGSEGFHNYRHQADVCHLYHTILQGGIPAENIIVMAYNDIAHNRRNPFPGKLFNHNSGNQSAKDYYEGCVIDYEKEDVNKNNLFAILQGQKDKVQGGNGRVLESTEKDTVFFYYDDHGGDALIAMPQGPYIYADQLQKVFVNMNQQNMFKKMVFYLSACHSASMFPNLPNNINVYAISSSDADKNAWATFCPPHDKVEGRSIGTCLSSEFPAAVIVNTDIINTNKESIQLQFDLIKKGTMSSTPHQFGDLEFLQEPIANFVGGQNQQSKPIQDPTLFWNNNNESVNQGSMKQTDVELMFLENEARKNPSNSSMSELIQYKRKVAMFKSSLEGFASAHQIELGAASSGTTDFECYRGLVDDLIEQCGKINDASMNYIKYLFQFCQNNSYKHYNFQCSEPQI